jgi:myo-inositol 2-dehydrogenase/D-chiro-inositol 1-dehydrogenase
MRIAMFGAGRIAPLHARTLVDAPGVAAVSITDVVPERAERVAAELGLEHEPSQEAALTAADAVVIVAATDAHAQLVREALARRLPTFCEKPLASTLAGSLEVAAAVEAGGVPFQLGFQRRFDPAYREAHRLVAEGEIGAIYTITLRSHDPEPASEEFIASSGGIFRDLSIHDLDVLRFLTGSEVAEVHAQGNDREFPVFGKYDDYATAVATLRMEDGVLALLSATRHDPLGHDVRTEVFGSRDSISVGLGPRMPLRSVEPGVPPPEGPLWNIFLDRWDEAYRDEMRAFVRVARGEAPSPCSARDGVEALRIAEALTTSAREHRSVQLSEVPA